MFNRTTTDDFRLQLEEEVALMTDVISAPVTRTDADAAGPTAPGLMVPEAAAPELTVPEATKPVRPVKTNPWSSFAAKRPGLAQFVVFSAINVGMTVLQLVVMPVSKWLFGKTDLVDLDFQWLQTGTDAAGGAYFIFDYAAGALPLGGGGLAYFLAVQLTLALAQFINFFLQRNVTFKSNTSPWPAALWYLVAYVAITFGAAALQGLYKVPIYELLITTWGLGASGEAIADVITMLINALISVCVFFPIFKIIFRRTPEDADPLASGAAQQA